jgi:hypothetical protein
MFGGVPTNCGFGKTSGIGTKSLAGFDSTTLVSAAGVLPSADLGRAFSVAAGTNPKSITNVILAVMRMLLRAILRISPSLKLVKPPTKPIKGFIHFIDSAAFCQSQPGFFAMISISLSGTVADARTLPVSASISVAFIDELPISYPNNKAINLLLHDYNFLQTPRRPHRPTQHFIRFSAIYKVLFYRVPLQFLTQPYRYTAQMTNRHGTMPRFDICCRLCPQSNTIKEILMMVSAAIKMNLIWSRC